MNLEAEKKEELRDIYDRYYHRLLFYASKLIADQDAAKDIVQELFVKLCTMEFSFENDYALSSYLYTSIYRASMNHLKLGSIHEQHKEIIRSGTDEGDIDNYVSSRIENEVFQEIFKAIDSLPDQCRKIFRMSYLDGKDIQSVASALGISPYTVKSQRARARQLLQHRLRNLFPLLLLFLKI